MRPSRFLPPLFFSVLTIILWSASSSASIIQQTWQADARLLELRDPDALARFLAEGQAHTEFKGHPALPLQAVSIAVPAGERVRSVRLEDPVTDSILLTAPLPAFDGTLSSEGGLSALADKKPASTLFPADHLFEFGNESYRGFAMAAIVLAPIQLERGAAGDRLHRLLGCKIVVETEPDPAALFPQRQSPDDVAIDLGWMSSQVLNPADLAAFSPATEISAQRGQFEPRGLPSIEGSGVTMVIICAAEHANVFQELAGFKTNLGCPTVVRDLDWIRASYPQGADLPETIRCFIQDAYAKWGIRYVLLAGDTDIIPVRYVLSYYPDPPELIPTDLYYSQLNGTWNADGDGFFGESSAGEGDGDLVEFVSDVYVGRIPVRDLESAQLLADKITAYTLYPDAEYVTNMSYFGEVLVPTNWHLGDPYQQIIINGASHCQTVYSTYQPAQPQIEALRYYETNELFPGSLPETVAAALDELENRAHIVHHVGHGFRYTMSVGNSSIGNSDALYLHNGLDHLFQVYAVNCTSSAIDFKCLMEAFHLAPDGGAITTIGSMRQAYPSISANYQNAYYGRLFANTMSIGAAFTGSHNQLSNFAISEGSHRWTQLIYEFLGDPSLNAWLDTPAALEVSLTAPYTLTSDTLRVFVAEHGAPVANALVVASKANEDRNQGTTNAAGQVALAFKAESTGSLAVGVTARNMYPWQGSFNVSSSSGAHLSAGALHVRDDPALGPPVRGNDDGVLDAGEIVRLGLTVHNKGNATAQNVSLAVSVPNGELAVLTGVYATMANVAAHDSLVLNAAFLLEAPFDLADRQALLLNFDLFHSNGTQHDQLDVMGHAPSPALFSFSVNDASGDGDGQPDAGETYALLPVWKNYGSTPIAGWRAELTPIDPAGHVLSGAVFLPELGLLERDDSQGFFINESSVSSPNRFGLTLTGPLGENIEDTLVVRRPAAPGALDLDSSIASTVIDVSWNIPVGGLPAGYLVYRGSSSGGPYELVSTEPTRHAYFRNSDLDENTRYYFVVETVDSSGYRSARSPEAMISTNPTMLIGWPLETASPSASSVAIADIDGDVYRELVAVSKYVYAWHYDGNEVVDGDHDAATFGVLNNEGSDFAGSVTLADVDPIVPGCEIVAACINPSPKLYVFHSDGSVMSGWPKSLPNWCWATPAAADVDLDGFLEIFVPCQDGKLYAFHHDGSEVINGDNDPLTDGVFFAGLGLYTKSSPALCQLDDDPQLEIIVGSSTPHKVFAWNHDGTTLAGWPVQLSLDVWSSPSVGDIDADGKQEIVVYSENDSLYVFKRNGQRYGHGFPVNLPTNSAGLTPSPALVDFDNDEQLEIVAAGVYTYDDMKITVLSNQGVVYPGWPIQLTDSSEGSPVVVDLDGDHALEILLGTENGLLYCWELNGNSVPGFPIQTDAELRSSPTIDDLDGDQSVDVAIIGWDNSVYVWDLPSFYENSLPQWKMFRANPARTGVFSTEPQNTGAGDAPSAPAKGALLPNFPNPFNPRTQIRFTLPAGAGAMPVILTVHDLQGRRIRTLFDGELPAGSIQSREWDGRDDAGRPQASGIYFARIRMSTQTFSRKMVLLK